MGTFLFIAAVLLAAFFIYMNFDDIKKCYKAAKGKTMTFFQWLKRTFFKTI
ncbi:hypothetical protein [Mucispirillum schaedleri]|uniref:hypothetical protein n=1 Tax=Mucispirillum schaedleri TaxID=248039 RepID=UPI001F56AE28|nr:hypothetical protein [Mucispirillum schaedleri]